MAETTYTYSVQDDFPNQQVELSVLESEILASTITTVLVGISLNDDDVDITFEDELSGAEVSTLDSIVANHTGTELFSGVQRVSSEGESTNSTTTYEDKLTLQSVALAGGEYMFTWYAEISLSSLITGSASVAQIRYNGVERGFTTSPIDSYVSFSGSATATVQPGDTPELVLAFRRVGLAATSRMRRARISIVPVTLGG